MRAILHPLISVIIVAYNSSQDIAACIEALLAADYPRLEISVVDNASVDGAADLVQQAFPGVNLVRSANNLGFGGGANLGFAESHGDILIVLNPDVRLRSDALRAFACAFAADSGLGIAGAKLLYPDGETLQHAGAIVEYPLATTRHRGYGERDRGQYDEPADVPFVTGAALALRRQVVQSTGGFDAGFFPVYYEDSDLCYRARTQGWRVVYLPSAVGLHRTSVSLDPASETYFSFFHANRLRFVLKHFDAEEIFVSFLPAEEERLRNEMPAADRRAARLLAQQTGAIAMTEQTESDRRLAEMQGGWQIRERPFTSRAPLVGPLLARFREAWNNVSTRWYVQPMIQQQSEFNLAVLRTVQALARRVEAQEIGAATTRSMLGQRLADVEERISRVEQNNPRT